MKRIKSEEEGAGRGESDPELIRLEKHVGLNYPNEHYKGLKQCPRGFVKVATHDTVGAIKHTCACASVRAWVKLIEVKWRLPWDSPIPAAPVNCHNGLITSG